MLSWPFGDNDYDDDVAADANDYHDYDDYHDVISSQKFLFSLYFWTIY